MDRKSLVVAAGYVLVPTVIIIAWQVVAVTVDQPLVVSPPTEVLPSMWHMITTDNLGLKGAFAGNPSLYANIEVTLYELGVAFALTSVLGVGLGFAAAASRRTRRFDPVIIAVSSIPLVIIYPILLYVLGLGTDSKIAYSVIGAFFPIYANSYAGFKSVPHEYVSLADSVGCNRFQKFYKIMVPSAAREVMTGLRVGFGLNFIGVVFAEYLGAYQGLGALLLTASTLYFTVQVYALTLITLAISVVGLVVMFYAEHLLRRF